MQLGIKTGHALTARIRERKRNKERQMLREEELLQRARADRNYYADAKNAAPQTLESDGDCASRPSIRRRIDAVLMQAQNTARQLDAAQRAKAIIDQHPEFAELLDALNEF